MSNQLNDLAAALEGLEAVAHPPPVRALVDLIRRFLIPRLTDPPPPLVVAVVGSTGAGKSTLVNSLAGAAVSKPGVLRPTTNHPVVWTSTSHSERWWPGEVVVGDHPLAESVALIDTPDIDSDVVEHRHLAMEAIAASDAVVFVTTSSRYGDAAAWEVLRLVALKPLVVVVNRLQTRASGARNDLLGRLRTEGMGSVPVLTISEQRIDPDRGRLSHQSVQRLAGVLREWAGRVPEVRLDAMEAAADHLAAELGSVIQTLEDKSDGSSRANKEVNAAFEKCAAAIAAVTLPAIMKRKSWWWPGRRRGIATAPPDLLAALDRAALEAAAALEQGGFDVPPILETSAPSTVSELSLQFAGRWQPDSETVREILERERQRFLAVLAPVPDGTLERLQHGAAVLGDLDWRNV